MPTIPSIRHDPPVFRAIEGRCRTLLDSMGQACVALDPSFQVLYCNPAYASLAGVSAEALVGRCLLTAVPRFVDSACHRACLHALETGAPQAVEETVNERFFLNRIYPTPEGVLAVIDDVTPRRQLEEELVHIAMLEQQVHRTQKLESLGLLAGGVAHDFNNLLVGILGTAEVLLRDLPAGSPQRPLVELVKMAGERAAELTRQMLVYAGKGPAVRRPLDLNTLIRESLSLTAAAVRKNIAFETVLAPDLPLANADPGQIQQVILNLILNAAEAIGPKPGQITLSTGDQLVDEFDRERDLPPGRYVFIEVADNGCGMNPEVAARIFDPFFTTKSSGRGLGMAVVQGIVRAHQGAIRMQSDPGEGTTFRVLLPAEPPRTG